MTIQPTLFDQPLHLRSFSGSDYVPKLDEERLKTGMQKIFDLMKDGNWRTLQEIEKITKLPTASVSAQLRNLKKECFGGHGLEKRRIEHKDGLWEYKLIHSQKTSGRG